MQHTVITPETHPDHEVVGRRVHAFADDQIHYCDHHHSNRGFSITRIDDPTQQRYVSERAIGGTVCVIRQDDNGRYRSRRGYVYDTPERRAVLAMPNPDVSLIPG